MAVILIFFRRINLFLKLVTDKIVLALSIDMRELTHKKKCDFPCIMNVM